MEFGFDPLKQSICQSVGDFFLSNLTSPEDRDWLNKILEGEKEAGIKVDGRKRDSHVLLINILRGLFDMGKTVVAEHVDTSQSLTDESLTEESDDTIHGSTDGASSSSPDTSKAKNGTANKPEKESKSDKSDKVDKSDKKIKALCRFYNNGKCKYNADCRFLHPKVCPKFRQHGDCKTKGCQGGCEFLHPNVCRTSLKDRTCTYPECRFFHLKGTKVIERRQNSNADSQNWRTKNKNNKPQGQNQGQNQRGTNKTPPKNASKNRQASLNARTKKKTPNPKQETVTLEEKKQLGQTLEAIMKRLDAMEAKPIYYPHPGMQMHPQVQPLMSPAVPQPGTQTQFQWASQAPWTPSQTQNSQ